MIYGSQLPGNSVKVRRFFFCEQAADICQLPVLVYHDHKYKHLYTIFISTIKYFIGKLAERQGRKTIGPKDFVIYGSQLPGNSVKFTIFL